VLEKCKCSNNRGKDEGRNRWNGKGRMKSEDGAFGFGRRKYILPKIQFLKKKMQLLLFRINSFFNNIFDEIRGNEFSNTKRCSILRFFSS
jgi:hypothetical protein